MLGGTPGGGMWRFLSPFLVTLGVQITVVFLALAYLLLAPHVRQTIERVGFVAILVLFAFGVADLAALARQLVKHGILRAHDAVLADEQRDVSRRSAS